MPKKKPYEVMSESEKNKLSILSKIIIFDVLKDVLTADEKLQYLKNMSIFELLGSDEEVAYEAYKNEYRPLKNEIQRNYNAYDDFLFTNTINEPYSNVRFTSQKDIHQIVAAPQMESPINMMLKTADKLAKKTDEYIKTLTDPDQIKYVSTLNTFLKDFVNLKFKKNYMENAAYEHSFLILTTTLAVSKPVLSATLNDDNTVNYQVDSMAGTDFKMIINAIKSTPILDTCSQGAALQKSLDKLDDYSLESRNELISKYESYLEKARQIPLMTEEQYNEVQSHSQNGSPIFQNDYDEFNTGSRGSAFMIAEAEFWIKALKAGWSKDDILVLRQYYYIMRETEKDSKVDNDFKDHNKKIFEKIKPVCDEVFTDEPITPERRLEILGKVKNSILLIEDDISKHHDNYNGTVFGSGLYIPVLKTTIQNRIDATLDPRDKLFMKGATPQDMIDALKAADKSRIKSSDEFKNMLKELNKLNSINKETDPEKYEFQQLRALKKAEEYRDYKIKQMKDPSHKRSPYEAKRVTSANAIINALKKSDPLDLLIEVPEKNQKIADVTLDFVHAKRFVYNTTRMEKGRTHILTQLRAMKTALLNTQSDKTKNFENKNQLNGSDTYKNMTQSLQDAIEKLENADTQPKDIKEALEKFQTRASEYQKDHDKMSQGNFLWRKTDRQKVAEKAIKDVPVMLSTYDHLRCDLAEFTDFDDKPYSHIKLSEAKTISDSIKNQYQQEFQNANEPDFDNEINTYDNISKTRLEIKKYMMEKSPVVAENYTMYRDPSYYSYLLNTNDMTTLAKAYIVKKAFDKTYRAASEEELNEIKDDITADGAIDKQAETLAKDPAFKLLTTYFPRTWMNKWDEVKDLSATISTSYNNYNQAALNEGQADIGRSYESIAEYAVKTNNINTEIIAEMVTRQIIATQKNQTIAHILALCEGDDRKNMFNGMINACVGYLTRHIDKINTSIANKPNKEELGLQKLSDLLNSSKIKKGLTEAMLRSQETSINEVVRVSREAHLQNNPAPQPVHM